MCVNARTQEDCQGHRPKPIPAEGDDRLGATSVGFAPFCAKMTLTRDSLCRIMAGVRRWMSAQPPPSVLKSIKAPAQGHCYRKPDPTAEPARDIDPTSTEGVVRRLLEPSVDREEEKEYERCVFPLLF